MTEYTQGIRWATDRSKTRPPLVEPRPKWKAWMIRNSGILACLTALAVWAWRYERNAEERWMESFRRWEGR